jgi:hypothetical protein
VDQAGSFFLSRDYEPGSASDQFWVLDASIGYRLPRRLGLITLEVRNLLDEEFKFYEMDPTIPLMYPERLVFARFTFAF